MDKPAAAAPARPAPAAGAAAASQQRPKPVPVSAVNAAVDVDVNALLSDVGVGVGVDGMDADVHVELTEADLNDAGLLGELHELTGGGLSDHEGLSGGGGGEHNHHNDYDDGLAGDGDDGLADPSADVATMMERMMMVSSANTANTTVVPEVQPRPPGDEEDILPLEYRLKTTDVSLLEKYIRVEKVRAVTKSRTGDKAGARESMVAFKALEAHLLHVTGGGGSGGQDYSADIQQLEQRVQQYKQLALAYRKQNDLAKAKDALLTIKKMESDLAQLQSGKKRDGFEIPPVPPTTISEPLSTTTKHPAPPPSPSKAPMPNDGPSPPPPPTAAASSGAPGRSVEVKHRKANSGDHSQELAKILKVCFFF